jgi:hypothetical protein
MSANVDKVLEYVLKNTKELPADKIQALASVIKALGTEIPEAPNSVDDTPDTTFADEQSPLDLTKITEVMIDGRKQKINIVGNTN